MQVQTILNRIERYPGFVYGRVELKSKAVHVHVRPRRGSKPLCSRCKRRCPGYDLLPVRRFQFVPVWGLAVYFLCQPRRVDCGDCGVVVEELPWGQGKCQLTRTYSWFLARWAKRLSWKEVAEAFETTWEHVFRSVEMAVEWGRKHMPMAGIVSIGIDEIQWQRGHKYLTLVYQIDAHCKRLLWIGQDRRVETLLRFFQWLGPSRSATLRYICSDMWRPYLQVIAKKAQQAIHVLDRFHVSAQMNKAVDEVRAKEARDLRAKGYHPILRKTRWLLLKRPENLSQHQEVRLRDLVQYNLRTVRSYLLKEDFQSFWEYRSPAWAGKFLDRWCTRVLRSRIEPMKKVSRTLRRHRLLLLNWFRAYGSISAGAVEGFNAKAKLISRRAYGFRTFRAAEVAMYHTLGKLPEPAVTHRFC